MIVGSQASQDVFVLALVTTPGFYLEIGASEPIHMSNTVKLEQAGWRGLSVDNHQPYVAMWRGVRRNAIVLADAKSIDYKAIALPSLIDYLSFDTDEYAVGWDRVPWSTVRFAVVTLEHNRYIKEVGDAVRDRQRSVLKDNGYVLACSDVCSSGRPFEDWWIASELHERLGRPATVASMEHDQACREFLVRVTGRPADAAH